MIQPLACYSYSVKAGELLNKNINKLLRVSLEPAGNNNVNVYLYTSKSDPEIDKKYYGKNGYVIDLPGTQIATTGNINLSKVSELVSKVNIVPFINTDNPQAAGMARVILDTRVPDLNIKVIIKPVNISNNLSDKPENTSARVYYPPGVELNQPQSMAFFTPLEEKDEPESIDPVIPYDYMIDQKLPPLIAQGYDDPRTKLQVSPPPEARPSVDPDNLEFLPDIGDVAQSQPSEEVQEGESPQPVPATTDDAIKSAIPKDVAGFIWPVCLVFIVILIAVALFILKQIKNEQARRRQKTPGIPTSPVINTTGLDTIQEMADFEEIEEIDLQEALRRKEARIASSDPFTEEVEEITVVDTKAFNKDKVLYLIRFSGMLSLIGTVDGDVTVLITFTKGELDHLASEQMILEVTKEGNVLGKEIYLVKIADWQGVVMSEDNKLSFHTNLSAPGE